MSIHFPLSLTSPSLSPSANSNKISFVETKFPRGEIASLSREREREREVEVDEKDEEKKQPEERVKMIRWNFG